jgi:SNF2 family DNA or RNA helicase
VVVFVNFRDTALMLADKGKANIIIGGQSTKERDRTIAEFQKNLVLRIVATLQAGGVGVNLQDLWGRSRVAILCPGYDSRLTLQALGRLPRAGSKSMALQYIVFAAGTVEVEVLEVCRENLAGINQFNDGDFVPPSLRGLMDYRLTDSPIDQ